MRRATGTPLSADMLIAHLERRVMTPTVVAGLR